MTRDEILAAAKRLAQDAEGPLSRPDFVRLTGISEHRIWQAFPDGGWRELRDAAGLPRHPNDNEPLSDDDLLSEYHRVCSDLGRLPTWREFGVRGAISDDVVRRRFGGTRGTTARYRCWLQDHAPDSPLLGLTAGADPRGSVGSEAVRPAVSQTGMSSEEDWRGSAEFGPPLDFRGLRHAPINEQGVVFLFGMVCADLGFVVEAIQASYPDCEAKRKVDPHGRRWRRVRIEFEYRSSSFREHGHRLDGCDMIVCWEHNWPECPLEVLELREVIAGLQPSSPSA